MWEEKAQHSRVNLRERIHMAARPMISAGAGEAGLIGSRPPRRNTTTTAPPTPSSPAQIYPRLRLRSQERTTVLSAARTVPLTRCQGRSGVPAILPTYASLVRGPKVLF